MAQVAHAMMVRFINWIWIFFNYLFQGYYDDGSNKLCLPCDAYCLTCNGGTKNHCKTCRSSDNRVISGS